MIRCARRLLVAGLAAIPLAPTVSAGQQADTGGSVRRVLERFPRNTGVRLQLGHRRVTGGLGRLTADSAYVSGLEWPVAVRLTSVDTVWQRIPGGESWKVVALMSAAGGALLFGYGAWGLCGASESYPRPNCTFAPAAGAILGAAVVGSVGAFLGGLGSSPARWERRFP